MGPGCRISLLLPSRATQPQAPQARRDLLQKDRSIQIQDSLGPTHSLSHCCPAKSAWDTTDIHSKGVSKGDRSRWLCFPGKSLLVASRWSPALLWWHHCPPGRTGDQEGFEAPRFACMHLSVL